MNARGRRTTAWDVTLDMPSSLGSGVTLPVQSRAQARRERAGPEAPAAGPVPDGEVAGTACRHGPADGPVDVGLQGLRRGRGADHAYLRRAEGTPADRDHRRHPLRDAVEPLRHQLQGRPLARAHDARPAEVERAIRARARGAGLHGERPARGAGGRRGPDRVGSRRCAARARPRLAASARRAVALLLEEREVAPRPGAAVSRASGSATATTTTPISGRSSATGFR